MFYRLYSFVFVLASGLLLIAALALLGNRGSAAAEARHNLLPEGLPAGLITSTVTASQTPTPAEPSATAGPSMTPTPVLGCRARFTALEVVPSASSGRWNQLQAVDAVSENEIWAVGQIDTSYPYGTPVPMIERWNGQTWDFVPSPVITGSGILYGVDALPSGEVWAVGYSLTTAGHNALIERWDGQAWVIVPSPVVVGSTVQLDAVSALSPTDAWAVGSSMDGSGVSRSLIIHWDGVAWSISDSPNPDTYRNLLHGVKAISPNDVWAVGEYDSEYASIALTLHWDGVRWSQVSVPVDELYASRLSAVDALAPDDVWAVGKFNYSNPLTLTMHWDGTRWTVVPSPNANGGYTIMWGISMLSHNEAWAAGGVFGSTFVMYWNGTGWTEIGTKYLGGGSGLFGIKALSTLNVWMVGAYWTTNNDLATLTMKYTGQFSDVHPTDYYYDGIRYLYCHNAVSGYSDGTFRAFNSTTRGQLAKMVVLAENIPINTQGGPHFSDVLPDSAFYPYVETAFNAHIISGYSDGSFRWGADVTRGQFSKIIVIAQHYQIDTSGGPHFTDVPVGSPFYPYIETAFHHTIITGYSDGTFRPGNNATRGQIAAIIQRAVVFP